MIGVEIKSSMCGRKMQHESSVSKLGRNAEKQQTEYRRNGRSVVHKEKYD